MDDNPWVHERIIRVALCITTPRLFSVSRFEHGKMKNDCAVLGTVCSSLLSLGGQIHIANRSTVA